MSEPTHLAPLLSVEGAGAWRAAAIALVHDLTGRGLEARIWAHGCVRARNAAVEPAAGDAQARVLCPGLRQDVVVRLHEDGTLWWFWVWSGATRDAPPDLEALCPLGQSGRAGEAIARVLAVPYDDDPAADDGAH